MTGSNADPAPAPAVHLFVGQGAQAVGMGRDLYDRSADARAVFDRADEVFAEDGCRALSTLCFDGPAAELTRTEICQPALYTVALAARAAAFATGASAGGLPAPVAVAGLSLGEWTALAAAGVVSFEDGLRLVRLRGRLMQEACDAEPGAMAAVIGLDLDQIEGIARESGVDVANLNSPGQVVLSGAVAAMQTARNRATAAGARRVVPLEVAGAYHSRLMQPAADGLARALADTEMRPARTPVVCNVSARPETDPGRLGDGLVRQLVSPVRWADSMQWCLDQGWSTFVEFGPGRVLSGLLRRIDRNALTHTIETFADAAAVTAGASDPRPRGES